MTACVFDAASWPRARGDLVQDGASLTRFDPMDLQRCTFAILLAMFCAAGASAQAEPSKKTEADCYAQQAQLEKDMRAARSRGQMLRRRQLEESLHALQTRCEEVASLQTHEGRVMRQKNVVLQLRLDLDRAEEELRRLMAEKN